MQLSKALAFILFVTSFSLDVSACRGEGQDCGIIDGICCSGFTCVSSGGFFVSNKVCRTAFLHLSGRLSKGHSTVNVMVLARIAVGSVSHVARVQHARTG